MKSLFMLAVRCEVLQTWAFNESSELLQEQTRKLLSDAGIKAAVYHALLASNLNCAAVAVEVECDDCKKVAGAVALLKEYWQIRYVVFPTTMQEQAIAARICDEIIYPFGIGKGVFSVVRKLQTPLANMRLDQKLHPQVWVYEREDGVHIYALSHPLHDQNCVQWQKHIGELLQASGFEVPHFDGINVSVL